MQAFITIFISIISLGIISNASAHHSFSALDFDTKIEKIGVITRYDFVQPHIRLGIEVTVDDGTTNTWEIENLVPRRWERLGLDRNFVKQGSKATIIGFPARNGSKAMMLSAIRNQQDEEMVALDEIS